MYTIAVGLRTYVVDNEMAADVLKEAAAFDKQGEFDAALEKKKLAARIENDRLFAKEWREKNYASEGPVNRGPVYTQEAVSHA